MSLADPQNKENDHILSALNDLDEKVLLANGKIN